MSEPAPGDGTPYRLWREAWQDALYGGNGFYRSAEGPTAHFETSAAGPYGSAGHTAILARALVRLAAQHGCDHLVDVGAGRGDLLAAVAGVPGAPHRLTGVDVVDRSAALPDGVGWLVSPGGAALPAALTGLTGALVVAHEWLDVVPCDIVQGDESGVPRLVEVDPATGAERLGRTAPADVLDWVARWWPHPADVSAPGNGGASPGADTGGMGKRVEVGLARDRAWSDLLARVEQGVVVAVDYGHTRSTRPPSGTLAAHRHGRLVAPVPDGGCDITADVAIDSLEGERCTQREMLIGLGIDATRPSLDLAATDPAAYLRALAVASAAATLLDPADLGGLWWVTRRIGHHEQPPERLGAC